MKMKKISLMFLSLLAFGGVTAQSEWKVDAAHSSITFEVGHLMISSVTGKFNTFDITAQAGDDFGAPEFTVTIQTTSVDTEVQRRDDHLRSADFFEVETYPEMTFETTSSQSTGDNTFTVTGNLTLHGVTKEVTLDGTVGGVITDQRSQKLKAGAKLTTSINRLDFGVGSDSPMIGTDIDVTIRLEMAQQ